jgi:hypothetical protein
LCFTPLVTKLLTISDDSLSIVAKAKPLILAIVGVLLLSFVVYNVEVGLYYFQYPDQLVHYKMEIMELISGNCDRQVINADLADHQSNQCLSPLGTYYAIDIIIAAVGFVFSISAPISALKQSGKLKISRGWSKNMARLRLVLGVSLITIAVCDAIGLLTTEGQPLDWAQVLGIPMPALIVEISLLILGVMVIKKAVRRLKSKPKSEFTEPWQMAGASDFRGSLEKKDKSTKKGGVMTVGDLRSALSLDQYEDIFQLGTSTSDDISVGRTCHYCNGQGCTQCDFKGELT